MILGLGLQVGEKGNSGDQLAVVTLVPANQSVLLSQSISLAGCGDPRTCQSISNTITVK